LKKLLLLTAGLLVCTLLKAQEYPRPKIDLEKFVEDLFNMQDADDNYEDLYESLLLLYVNPLNLNDATREELRSLYILSEQQINNFLQHRERTGKLLSIYELQAVAGFDLQTIYNLLPFVTVADAGFMNDSRGLWQRIRDEQNNFLLLRANRVLEHQVGYTPAIQNSRGEFPQRYLGDPWRLYARYQVRHNKDFSIGFTLEKDAGEQLVWNPSRRQYLADFISAHFYVENKGKIRKAALGDYQYQFGQGLVTSAGFRVGKGGEPITTVRRANIGIRPFTSVLEGLFFRGGAITYAANKNIDITGFVSRKGVTATLQETIDTLEDGEVANIFASSINITGFHRTPNELSRKHALGETIAAGSVQYHSNNKDLEAGVLIMQQQYDKPWIRNDLIYNQFDFRGSSNTNISAMLNYNWQNFTFFSEAATSSGGGVGAIAGTMASLSPRVDFSMVTRSYSPDFHAFYGNAFGEAARVRNERGIYWGLKIRPTNKWILAGYYDQFVFPWLAFQADAPSQGDEYLVRVTYLPSKMVNLFFQFRTENKERNMVNNLTRTDFLTLTSRRNFVINLDVRTPEKLSFKSRLQWSTWEQQNGAPQTAGLALMQDINYDFGSLSISNRFALFQTDDFNNRQYVYEKNVLYQFAIPAYFGRGFRAYTLWQYTVNRRIDLWMRLSRTWFKDQTTIGSGLEQINGRQRTDLFLQLRYKFRE
jgi:hypothetical protein